MKKIDKELDDAINRADLVTVKKLVDGGADIEYRDAFGCTAIMNAAWVAAEDIVIFLLAKGADGGAKNSEGLTALEMARSVGHDDYGHASVIKVLAASQKS